VDWNAYNLSYWKRYFTTNGDTTGMPFHYRLFQASEARDSELPDYTIRQLSLLDTSLGQELIKGQQVLCDANPNTGRTLAF